MGAPFTLGNTLRFGRFPRSLVLSGGSLRADQSSVVAEAKEAFSGEY